MNRKNWFILSTFWLMAFAMITTTGYTQIEGNGKIVKEERKLSDFKAISVKNAIHLKITQGTEEKVVVETDENVLPYLNTEVSGGELKIGIKGSVNNTKVMNVYVTVKTLNALETSSAAKATSENKIETNDLKISSSSGSAVKLDIVCTNLDVKISSGCAVALSGSAQFLRADASSGSALSTAELKAEKGELSASSGAALAANVSKEVRAHASSGARIAVTGNPSSRDSDSSSGGSVKFK